MQIIYAIAGKAGSGKDTAGDMVSEMVGLPTDAYADDIKRDLGKILGIDLFKVKKTPKLRKLMIEFAESICKYDPYFWINKVMSRVTDKGLIITDLRKFIEWNSLKDWAQEDPDNRKLVSILVYRPDWHNDDMDEDGLSHYTENEVANSVTSVDHLVVNDHGLDKLRDKLKGIVDGDPKPTTTI